MSEPFAGRRSFHAGLKPDYTGRKHGLTGLPLLSKEQLVCYANYANFPEWVALG